MRGSSSGGASVHGTEGRVDAFPRSWPVSLLTHPLVSFGLYAAFVISASKMKVVDSTYQEASGTAVVDNISTEDVGLGLGLPQWLGGYYGWYIGIPHFGNLGAELQFGSRLVASLSYQYMF